MKCGHVLILGLVASFALSGCSSLKLEDVAGPAVGATVATTAAVLTVNPVAAIAVGAAAGAATEVAIPEPASVDITQVENEHQAEVAKKKIEAEWWEDFTHWIIGGGVLLVIAAWLIPGPQWPFGRKTKQNHSLHKLRKHRRM